MKIIQAMAISFTLIFAGCASVPTTEPQTAYQYDSTHSKAWNIATAAGLKNIKDYVVTDHTDRNALALGGAYAAASHFAGVGFSPADIGFGLLGSIATSGQIPPETEDHLFIWMPFDQAKNGDKSVATAMEIYEDTVKNAKKKIEWASKWDTSYDTDISTSSVISPNFIGGYKSWFISAHIQYGLEAKGAAQKASGNDVHFFSVTSHLMPQYVYIYLAATQKHGPLIINQGKLLYFVQNMEVASP